MGLDPAKIVGRSDESRASCGERVAWSLRPVIGQAMGGAVGATLVGVITGFVLIPLLRHPAPEGWND